MNNREAHNELAQDLKRRLRERHLPLRGEQADKAGFSRRIINRLITLPEYQVSRTLSTYVGTPTEVQTVEFIVGAWRDGKEVAVPCCVGNELRMFHLTSMDELAPRTLGILEPRADLRQCSDRWLDVSRIDLFVVPGIAFDHSGGRLGYGKGYYDRLLSHARRETPKIAVAFPCQMIDRVPMTPWDVFMDGVVTDQQTYRRAAE